MFHVGLDIHSTRISVCALNGTGQVVHRSQVRTTEEMVRVLKDLPDLLARFLADLVGPRFSRFRSRSPRVRSSPGRGTIWPTFAPPNGIC
jgi:predicted NBD/HSP70 family sugar kinase